MTEKLSMAGILVHRRVIHHPSGVRVEMFVRKQLIEVLLIVHEYRLIPPLAKRAVQTVDAVVSFGESDLQRCHGARERNSNGTQKEVIVIRHERPSEKDKFVPRLNFRKLIYKDLCRSSILENRFSPRDSAEHMVDPTIHKHSWFPRHKPLPARCSFRMKVFYHVAVPGTFVC